MPGAIMNVQQLYERGYALGTGAKLAYPETGDTYVLANTQEFEMCAINIRTGNRFRDPTEFNCSYSMDIHSAERALGFLEDWMVVV